MARYIECKRKEDCKFCDGYGYCFYSGECIYKGNFFKGAKLSPEPSKEKDGQIT